MDAIQEGITIIKFEKDQNNIFNPRIEYQNLVNKIMFQSSNTELLKLFEQLPCEILREDSPVAPRSSLLSFQSFNQKQIKQMKNSQKISRASMFIKDQSILEIVSPQQRLRSLTAQINTVYKCIQYVFQVKKMKYEINGKIEATIIETVFDQNEQKRTIEIIITITGEDLILLVARDVVHRKNIKELLEINQSKSRTLSFVSHEFRSPLNVMINILNEIKDKYQVEQELHENITIVLENTNYMLNLANDLLDLSQIKADKFRLNIKTLNIIDLVNECLQLFKLQAQQRQVQLKVYTNQKPLYIKSDRNRLKQILINLIANAMKFTSKGQITIKIHQKGFLVDIGVVDTGIGINEENQKKLFKAFGKIMNNENKKLNEQGVGLGLLISNKIAQQLSNDGTGLKIQSKDASSTDHGSYFYLTLNLQDFHFRAFSSKLNQIQIDSDIPQQQYEENLNYSQFFISYNRDQMSFSGPLWVKKIDEKPQCCHILIVDDNAFNLKILEMLIKQFTNSQIDKSNDGTEALKAYKEKKCNNDCQGYSAIFMDMEMPGLNGLETSKQIFEINQKQKIFIVSGYEDQDIQQNAYKLGIKEFIVKPLQKERIQKIIIEHQL